MPLKPKKIPMRMCVACREMRPKAELLRVVKPQDGEAHIDFKGKAPGARRVYLPQRRMLRARAQDPRPGTRAGDVHLPPRVFDALEEQLKRGG